MGGTSLAPHGQLARSITWLGLSLIVSKISTLVGLFVLGRYLGEETFGRFAVAFAIPAALESLADLGISWALVREGASRRSEVSDLAVGVIVPKLVLACLMVAATLGIVAVLGLPEEVAEAALYLGIARAIDSLTYLARAVFQATEQMQYDAASYTLDGAVRFALIAYGVASGFGVVGFAKALAVASIISMSGTWVVLGHRFLRPPRAMRIPWRLIAAGLPLAAIWLLDSAAIRIGTIVVGTELGGAAAGGLAAAMRIIEPMLSVPAVIAAALLPLTTRHIVQRQATLPRLLPASLRAAVMLASAATVILAGLGALVVSAVFGPEFELAGQLLRLLALGLVPLFMRTILIAFFLALRAQTQLILAQLAGVGTSLALTLALLPHVGPLAAVVGLIFGEWVSIVVAALLLPALRAIGLRGCFAALPPLGLALLVLVLGAHFGELFSTALALLAFILLVRMLGAVDERDLAYAEDSIPLIGRLGRLLMQR